MATTGTTAAQVKRAWEASLRRGLTERGFRKHDAGAYRRRQDGSTDGLVLRLRSAGRGETATDLTRPALRIRVDAVHDQISRLSGTPQDPDVATWASGLAQVLKAYVDASHDDRAVAAGQFKVDSLEAVEAGTATVLGVLDQYAEPWFAEHHDLTVLYAHMDADPAMHQLGGLERLAALAGHVGNTDLIPILLSEFDSRLKERDADHPAFTDQRRWRSAMAAGRDAG